tara:strand:- start:243854 stop:244309 length:456 start_codon:yes stop_codon:yes gene_type:complete
LKYLILLSLGIIFSTSTFAFSFKHLDCKIRLNKTKEFLNKEAHKKLKDKGFRPMPFVESNKMNVGDLYFELEVFKDPKKLWKDCIVTAAVKKAKNQRASSNDKELYKKAVKRALPRHTFDGNERCKRALKDVFIHIPYCQTMTVDEKVQGN